MKRNFLTLVALMVSALFIGATIAEAADVKFGGQLRPRFEVNEQSDFSNGTDADWFISQRTRLNADVNVNADTSAFIQLQSNYNFGVGGNAAAQPNDADASVGIHQAYFVLKNLYGLPVDAKIGRQEIVFDGHRIFGNTGWTQGAQTHDAAALIHSAGDHTIVYGYSMAVEVAGAATNDNDVDVHFVYAQQKGILGGALSGYWVYYQDKAGNASVGQDAAIFHTLGARQAGSLYGIDYRGEVYWQVGDNSKAYNAAITTVATAGGNGARATDWAVNGGEMDAFMWGARAGHKFADVMWKPSLTLWYDYLSGQSDENAREGKWGSYNTLFDTGHKFYGFMDNFLTTAKYGNLGLQDFAVKVAFQPVDKWTVKADWHKFTTAENPAANPLVAASANARLNVGGQRNVDGDLGNELDVTVINKYNENVNISYGYSVYNPDAAFSQINSFNQPADNAQWGYVMFDVKF